MSFHVHHLTQASAKRLSSETLGKLWVSPNWLVRWRMTKNLSWYRAVAQEYSVNAVAKRAGTVQTTLAAQVRKGELTLQSVIAIAHLLE